MIEIIILPSGQHVNKVKQSGVSIPHALSEIFRCVAAGDTLKFYLLISNFYLLDVAVSATSKQPRQSKASVGEICFVKLCENV